MSIDKQIKSLETIQHLRNKLSLSEDERQLASSYSGLSDQELAKSLAFYRQLQLGWIYLENFNVDYNELTALYDNCKWIAIYEDSEYKGSQSYAEIQTPKFVQDQIPLKFYHLSSFLKIHAGAVLHKHSHETGRNTALVIPFKGEQKTIPLQFWKDEQTLLSEVIIDRPTIINTNILHGIDKISQQERTNYNLNFDFPFTFASVSDILVNRIGL